MAYQRVIWVSPLADGWTVRCAELEPLVFRSGRRAEEQAKALAACLARLGRDAQVRIQDRSMNLVGTQHFPAD
ncbi:hypothetical protein [Phenylobacterium zucineum]|uniref:hypothetical protein n=1 Tax=Phenylobacterium zucineum TaxID=284016 RepID=UPI0002E094EA|nr:hypothetical protein [Phenylobacterium zucineum]